MASPRATRRRLLEFGLGLPEAYEDHPWGEDVVKVRGKIVVFLGLDEDPSSMSMTVKLDDSHEQALAVPGAAPAGYGLGRSGWVTIPLGHATPPLPVLRDWIEESYRRVAPKALAEELDRRSAGR